MLAHRKYRRPRSRPLLIDHIFLGKNNSYSTIYKPILLREPKEHHRKTILTKNEKMMIVLAEDMACSTTDISDVLLERWLELLCCFSVYSSLTLLSTKVQRRLLILILLFYLFMLARELMNK